MRPRRIRRHVQQEDDLEVGPVLRVVERGDQGLPDGFVGEILILQVDEMLNVAETISIKLRNILNPTFGRELIGFGGNSARDLHQPLW